MAGGDLSEIFPGCPELQERLPRRGLKVPRTSVPGASNVPSFLHGVGDASLPQPYLVFYSSLSAIQSCCQNKTLVSTFVSSVSCAGGSLGSDVRGLEEGSLESRVALKAALLFCWDR